MKDEVNLKRMMTSAPTTLALLLMSSLALGQGFNPASSDLSERLGVSQNASQDEITIAYRKAMKRYHSDAGGTKEQAQQIGEAYNALKKAPAQDFERAPGNALEGLFRGWKLKQESIGKNFAEMDSARKIDSILNSTFFLRKGKAQVNPFAVLDIVRREAFSTLSPAQSVVIEKHLRQSGLGAMPLAIAELLLNDQKTENLEFVRQWASIARTKGPIAFHYTNDYRFMLEAMDQLSANDFGGSEIEKEFGSDFSEILSKSHDVQNPEQGTSNRVRLKIKAYWLKYHVVTPVIGWLKSPFQRSDSATARCANSVSP